MKYLRKFDERLSPETYKSAGVKLKNIGKPIRGSNLITYHDEIVSGFYNTISIRPWDSNYFKWSHIVTRPSSEFIFGSTEETTYNDAEDLVNNWIIGANSLSFTIKLNFILKDDPNLPSERSTAHPIYLCFMLNNWGDGKQDYIYDFDRPDDLDIYDFYKDSNSTDDGKDGYTEFIKPIYINSESKINKTHKAYTLFSDRKSAIKFKKSLKDLIIGQHINKIMDIFNIIGADSDDIKGLEQSIDNIRLNKIYIDPSSDNLNRSFQTILSEPINN